MRRKVNGFVRANRHLTLQSTPFSLWKKGNNIIFGNRGDRSPEELRQRQICVCQISANHVRFRRRSRRRRPRHSTWVSEWSDPASHRAPFSQRGFFQANGS